MSTPATTALMGVTCVGCMRHSPKQTWAEAEVMHVSYTSGRGAWVRWYLGTKGWEALVDPKGVRVWCPRHAPRKKIPVPEATP